MKTERRHELQKNELADSLAHVVDRVKPYTRLMVGAIIAAVAGCCIYAFASARHARSVETGWDRYFTALSRPNLDKAGLHELKDLAEQYPGTTVGQWAAIRAAEIELAQGTQLLLTDKPQAKDYLTRALDGFLTVSNNASQSDLKQRALFGLARANESLGDLDAAKKNYRQLASQWPNSPLGKASAERAKDLEKPATKQFYDWFASYQPARPMSKEPGTPGVKPDFSLDNLNTSDIKLPSLVNEKSGDDGEGGSILNLSPPLTAPPKEEPGSTPTDGALPTNPSGGGPQGVDLPPLDAPSSDTGPVQPAGSQDEPSGKAPAAKGKRSQ